MYSLKHTNYIHVTCGPAHEIFVLIALPSNEGSGNLRTYTDSPEPLLLAYIEYGCRSCLQLKFRPQVSAARAFIRVNCATFDK